MIYIYISIYIRRPLQTAGGARQRKRLQEMDDENEAQEHEKETRSKTKKASWKKKSRRKRKKGCRPDPSFSRMLWMSCRRRFLKPESCSWQLDFCRVRKRLCRFGASF